VESPIELICEGPSLLQETEDLIISCVSFMLKDSGIDSVMITVTVTDSARIAGLNETYRGKSGSTDILSFPQFDTIGELKEELEQEVPVHLGDLVISLEDVKNNCREFGVEFIEELPRLIIHGMLHIVGETHSSYEAEEPMLRHQEQLLRRYLSTRRKNS